MNVLFLYIHLTNGSYGMIKQKTIKVKISSRNSYLKDKYECNFGDEIEVNINDISKNSHMKITAICDICGAEKDITIHKYHINKERQGYYGCGKCRNLKYKKSNQ